MSKHKRGNGEGSIYKMQDGRWRAALTVGKKTGRQTGPENPHGSHAPRSCGGSDFSSAGSATRNKRKARKAGRARKPPPVAPSLPVLRRWWPPRPISPPGEAGAPKATVPSGRRLQRPLPIIGIVRSFHRNGYVRAEARESRAVSAEIRSSDWSISLA